MKIIELNETGARVTKTLDMNSKAVILGEEKNQLDIFNRIGPRKVIRSIIEY